MMTSGQRRKQGDAVSVERRTEQRRKVQRRKRGEAVVDERRKRFRKALALAELTMGQWAEREGISYGHLYHVMSGRRESVSLTARVDAFIAANLGAAVVAVA